MWQNVAHIVTIAIDDSLIFFEDEFYKYEHWLWLITIVDWNGFCLLTAPD